MRKLFILLIVVVSCKKEIKTKKIDTNVITKTTIDSKGKTEVFLPNKVKIKSYDEDTVKDLIIDRESIVEYLDFEFLYEKFNKEIKKDKIILSNARIRVEVEKTQFKDKNSYVQDSFIGVNYNFPEEIISSIKVFFDDKEINNKTFKFSDLAEPNFDSTEVLKVDTNNIILEMHNSDGAGGYAVYFFINKNGNSKRYIVYP